VLSSSFQTNLEPKPEERITLTKVKSHEWLYPYRSLFCTQSRESISHVTNPDANPESGLPSLDCMASSALHARSSSGITRGLDEAVWAHSEVLMHPKVLETVKAESREIQKRSDIDFSNFVDLFTQLDVRVKSGSFAAITGGIVLES
jgi:hypothetical protein